MNTDHIPHQGLSNFFDFDYDPRLEIHFTTHHSSTMHVLMSETKISLKQYSSLPQGMLSDTFYSLSILFFFFNLGEDTQNQLHTHLRPWE